MSGPHINLVIKDSGESNYSTIQVQLDGEEIAFGSYGGEPEDNMRRRDYHWVESAIQKVATALGATTSKEVSEMTEEDE